MVVSTLFKATLPIALDVLTQLAVKKYLPDSYRNKVAYITRAGTAIGSVSMLLISRDLNKIPNVLMISGYVTVKLVLALMRSAVAKSGQEYINFYQDEAEHFRRQDHNRYQALFLQSLWPPAEKG